jgi:hypothetical protein
LQGSNIQKKIKPMTKKCLFVITLALFAALMACNQETGTSKDDPYYDKDSVFKGSNTDEGDLPKADTSKDYPTDTPDVERRR